MPLRALAARLRKVIIPLVESRLKEQEENVQTLLNQTKATQRVGGDSKSLEEDLRIQSRIVDTLRHWNPGAARDRTLG